MLTAELAHFQDLSFDEREDLLSRIETARQEYSDITATQKELGIVCKNIGFILDTYESTIPLPLENTRDTNNTTIHDEERFL